MKAFIVYTKKSGGIVIADNELQARILLENRLTSENIKITGKEILEEVSTGCYLF